MGPSKGTGVMGKVAAAAAAEKKERERLRREDHLRVKHDKLFSDWKILVGPGDWKESAAGEEGSQMYRLHNLPATYFGPGVYELGLTQNTHLATTQDAKQRKLRRHAVLVVYLGQADNVRQRLQRYGQTGSHLEGARSASVSAIEEDLRAQLKGSGLEQGVKVTSNQGGLRLFTEVFSRGYSIAFRWARTESKKSAEEVESELLRVFDYPWNTALNGSRRPREILAKLDMVQYQLERNLCLGPFLKIGRKWDYLDRKVGISVAVRKPKEEGSCNPKYSIFFSSTTKGGDGAANSGSSVCGVLLGDGSTCRTPAGKGLRRCIAHKGLRAKLPTRGAGPRSHLTHSSEEDNTGRPTVVTITAQVKGKRVEITNVSSDGLLCGAVVDGGSPCLNRPVQGRKRCANHKGIRIPKSKPKESQKI